MIDNPKTSNTHSGRVIAVRGNVVDVHFSPPLPARNHQLRANTEDSSVVLEIQAHLDTITLRCIALNATRRLQRGMPVQDTGKPLQMPVGEALLGRMLNVFGEAVDDGKEAIETQEYWSIHRPLLPLADRTTSTDF